ncbi:acyl-CoA dehydrogenase family protein [Yimella sp. cx-51]|uniref:acyl-CoA dehydrogenase family protein n=1 Tax=Yimella sp. cx-51 TaxID=2770551 RepID=UPI00165E5569|nr:acyl-CoA dehydrogenase family protein [Yimella sp. cx-51]MBC9955827.1 acyl-CoA dehydrogenase family protein [Yimella sp. cx-51]QTH37622.1 acyl-CoA dehydrogenase family protein [Yimella sp. cx-51]
MPVERLLPTDEAADLLVLTRDLCDKEVLPPAAEGELTATPPRDLFRTLGRAGLLSLPYPEEFGGAGQPYEVYLQVIEEIAQRWMAVAVGVSVHCLTAYPVAEFGSTAQQEALLPEMLGGEWLGAYGLSEREAGSDIAQMRTRAVQDGGGWRLKGTKAWISHAAHADFYTTFARTDDTGGKGLSCFVVPAGADGLRFGSPERKMGLHADPVAEVIYDDVPVSGDRLIGERGQGMAIALSALDAGRLGIAAAATGLAQAALDHSVAYAKERHQFGRPIADNQGLAFMLADMEAAVSSARATYLHAARLKDAGRPFSKAAAVAKLVATDAAMKVTGDAVQVLGGAGYTQDFPVERFFRDAKVTQIFEGTNQIQRLVISRQLLAGL